MTLFPGEAFAEPTGPNPPPALVGDEVCAACHQEQAAPYRRTAHALTSSLPGPGSVHGRFDAGANTLRTANPDLYFQMESRAEGYFQTGVLRTSPTQVMTRSERIGLVVGSGRKGQTYLFWDGDLLYQLPVSFYTKTGTWVNSPGYADGTADFDRPIARRCLECHASFFASRSPPENRYAQTSLVLGISCEKCHGPGGAHVARYRSATPPRSPADAAIVNPARLPRDRQVDICSLCHAGAGEAFTPPLSFAPGDVLSRHLVFPPQPPGARIDVHASQVQLLARSRCYQASPAMSCGTCHDVHQPQRDLAAMASRCTACHRAEVCREVRKQGPLIASRCVECHMPLEQTDQILIAGPAGGKMDPRVRNHRIAIYPGGLPP